MPTASGCSGRKDNAGLAQQVIARDGGLDANSVAALAVGGDGAAMREAAEGGERQAKDFVIGTAVQGRNEADSAGFVLETGVEKVLATRRKAATTHRPLYMDSGGELKREVFLSRESCRQGCCSPRSCGRVESNA